MKDNQEVIQEFNELVNMTASDLEKWLKSDDSNSAGWPKETEDGETVGHDSGRKIVEILKENPNKDPENYTEDQVTHMRKVVAYCKRHLAQETKGNSEKSPEEVKRTKSYASLKNWGHDFLKAQGKADSKESESKSKDDEEAKAGDKRNTPAAQSGSNKKQQTQKGKATKKDDEDEDDDDDENETKTRSKTTKDDEDDEMKEAEGDEDEDEDEEEEDDDEEEQDEQEDGQGDAENQTKRQTRSSENSHGTNRKARQSTTKSKRTEKDTNDEDDEEEEKSGSSKKGPKKGDTVSWSWGSGNPKGKVLDVKEEDTTITTKKGNKVTRKGTAEDPAIVLDAGSSKAIKSDHELN